MTAARSPRPRASWQPRSPAKAKGCGRCVYGVVRTLQEIAEELRTYAPKWRAWSIEGEIDYLAKSGRPADAGRMDENAGRLVAHCAEEDLPALAAELTGLCRCCARRAAESFTRTRQLAFIGLLRAFRSTGRDERAQEEFQFQAVAA